MYKSLPENVMQHKLTIQLPYLFELDGAWMSSSSSFSSAGSNSTANLKRFIQSTQSFLMEGRSLNKNQKHNVFVCFFLF